MVLRPSILRVVLASFALLGLLLSAVPAARAEPRPASQPVLHLDSAQFEADGAEPRRVALPDTWRGDDGRDPAAWGRYRLTFRLEAPPDEPLALIFTQLSVRHALWLNGALVSGDPQQQALNSPGHPMPLMVTLPPALLRVGANELLVDVRHGMRPGLSDASVGPLGLQREAFQMHLMRSVELPQALNTAAAGLALFMVALWWRRRAEVAIGSFGLLSLAGSARNYSYYLYSAATPPALTSLLFYWAQIGTVLLFGVFAQAFAGVRWRWYGRTLVGVALALAVLGAVAMPLGHGEAVRRFTYPLLFLLALPALWLCVTASPQRRAADVAAPRAMALALVVAGAHDYLVQTSRLPVTEPFWMPFVMPVALAAVAIALLRRFVVAMGEVEAVNTRLEQRVAERTRELETANAAKTRFIAAASHDLRQPLVTVGLLVGMAREDASSESLRRMLERAGAAVDAMESLLTGLLDLSRLESGAVRPVAQPVPLAALFAAVAAHEQAHAAQRGLRLRFADRGAVAWSDPLVLERIVRNLVVNAISYTARGSVMVVARRRGATLRIEVRDSGPGIPPEHQRAIFEEFSRLPPAAEGATRGLGLGLAIAQRSAEMLGHRLGLRSAPGRGSCFWVELTPASGVAASPAPAAPAEAAPSAALAGRRVVLVEDDPAVRQAMTQRLQRWGAEVLPFAGLPSLQDWLARAAVGPAVAAVVSDYRLPQGDGLQAIAAVRERFGPVPAVVTTGDSAPAELARLDAAGARVLHKPFGAEALLAALSGA